MIVRHEAGTGVTAKFTAAAADGHAVKVSGAKTVAPAGPADVVVGTAIADVKINENGVFRTKGDIVPMIADGAIAAGAVVVGGTTAGRVKTRAAETAEFIIGVAFTAATAAGNEILVIQI